MVLVFIMCEWAMVSAQMSNGWLWGRELVVVIAQAQEGDGDCVGGVIYI